MFPYLTILITLWALSCINPDEIAGILIKVTHRSNTRLGILITFSLHILDAILKEHRVRVLECCRQKPETRRPSAYGRSLELPIFSKLLTGRGYDIVDFFLGPWLATMDLSCVPSKADRAAGGIGVVPIAILIVATEWEFAGSRGRVSLEVEFGRCIGYRSGSC